MRFHIRENLEPTFGSELSFLVGNKQDEVAFVIDTVRCMSTEIADEQFAELSMFVHPPMFIVATVGFTVPQVPLLSKTSSWCCDGRSVELTFEEIELATVQCTVCNAGSEWFVASPATKAFYVHRDSQTFIDGLEEITCDPKRTHRLTIAKPLARVKFIVDSIQRTSGSLFSEVSHNGIAYRFPTTSMDDKELKRRYRDAFGCKLEVPKSSTKSVINPPLLHPIKSPHGSFNFAILIAIGAVAVGILLSIAHLR